jgi:acyl transferase domain-containing protein
VEDERAAAARLGGEQAAEAAQDEEEPGGRFGERVEDHVADGKQRARGGAERREARGEEADAEERAGECGERRDEERGAPPLAELIGYGASSDGADMVVPSPTGIAHAMRAALDEARISTVNYVNTHATATAIGDIAEVQAMREVFGNAMPPFSSTKGLTGHAVAASGAQEAIYCLLMMEHGFVAGCANLEDLDPAVREMPIVRATREARLATVMSNSLGFGGTNACLIFRQWRGAPG